MMRAVKKRNVKTTEEEAEWHKQEHLRLKKACEKLTQVLIVLQKENGQLQAENKKLRAALKKYGMHLPDCPADPLDPQR